MRPIKVILFLCVPLIALSACSAKVSHDLFPDISDSRQLKTISSEPLSGTVDSQSWKATRALATRTAQGEYSVTIVGEGVEINCNSTFPLAPHLTFVVPNGTGSYPYDGSPGENLRLVNVIFPYTTNTGGGSDNILASKSLIQIDSIGNGVITGGVSALSPIGENRSYEFSGRFQATICNDPQNSPLSIKRNGAAAFAIAYSEAVRYKSATGSTIYEVRIMDRAPKQKCNSWDAWMMTEAPIKYVTISVPAQVGSFNISKGLLEYGDQGSSSGWSTDVFNGSGRVQDLSASEITIMVSAKDFGSFGFEINGSFKSSLCAH